MGRRTNKIKHVWVVGIYSLLVLLSTLPLVMSAHAQTPDDDCLHYAYTFDSNHYFLLQDNSVLFGENLILKHNCEYLRIYVDGEFTQESSNNFSIELTQGYHNITIETPDHNYDYNSIRFIPSTSNWLIDFEQYQYEIGQKEFTQGELSQRMNWVALGSGLLVFLLSVGFYWKIINHYVDRNHIEEVF